MSTEHHHSDNEQQISRRQFLSRMSIVLGSIGAAAAGIPVIGFIFEPLLRKPPEVWRTVGLLSDFAVGQTVKVVFEDASPLPWSGVTAKTAAWLRRESDDKFTAYAINCTHLGCPVNWLPKATLFMCPCHGGVFYKDGSVAAGPPPKPLQTYPVRISADKVQIQPSPIPIT